MFKHTSNIGTLYFIFGLIAGVAGTALSLFIRVTLYQPDCGFLDYNHQLYNGALSHSFCACILDIIPVE